MEHKFRLSPKNPKSWGTFDNSFPLGNGKLGAMVMAQLGGGMDFISLNQDSLWHGPAQDRNNPDAIKYYKKIRELLKNGEVDEADKLCYMAMTSMPKYFGAYEPMGKMHMYFIHDDNITGLMKELDLQNGVATMDYKAGDLSIHREYFVSRPDNVFAIKITADKPELDVFFNVMRRPCENGTEILDNNILCMSNQCGVDGVKFTCSWSAKTDGEFSRIGDFIGCKNASEIIIYLTADTSFYTEDYKASAIKQLTDAMAKDYDTIKSAHVADFSALFHRSAIDFGTQNTALTTDRLENLRNGGDDPGFAELIFNYGKYLLISSSRPGCQPANLQGIWCDKFAPEWECNYTININLQINYWIAEIAGLSECHEPFFDLLERMVPNGERTARTMYGCDGFMAHHCTNLWGDTAIEGNSFPSSVWPVGGAWLCKHLWDRYLYTQDKEFLEKRAFPILKKAALFFSQYLDEAEDGCLVTGPSLSPENVYITDKGREGRHCMAPEMDNQIVRCLFRAVLGAYDVLGCHDDQYELFRTVHSKLRPTRINQYGSIMEWDKDYVERDPGHRHISPLFALHPDYEITPDLTPELAEACDKTIQRRLEYAAVASDRAAGSFQGWNGAWLSCCYSRLEQGENAMQTLLNIWRNPKALTDTLLNKYPVFQIDGNFGMAAAVAEMVISSDEYCVKLLPALPKLLKDGSFRGLCTRGGNVFDAEWKDGKLTKASFTARANGTCHIKAKGVTGADAPFELDGDFITITTEAGKTYHLCF